MTVVVEQPDEGGSEEVAEVAVEVAESVAEAVADAVEAVAEAIADTVEAVAEAGEAGGSSEHEHEWRADHESRISACEAKFAAAEAAEAAAAATLAALAATGEEEGESVVEATVVEPDVSDEDRGDAGEEKELSFWQRVLK